MYVCMCVCLKGEGLTYYIFPRIFIDILRTYQRKSLEEVIGGSYWRVLLDMKLKIAHI